MNWIVFRRVHISVLCCLLLLGCDKADSSCAKDTYIIAIDIGHTATRAGATSARGVAEYEFNQNLAHRLLAELHAAGFTEAFLLEQKGQDIPLLERAEVANERKAQILLSIHHDSVQPRYLESWTFEGERRKFSDRFTGFSLFYSEKNGKSARSLQLARTIGQQLLEAGLTPSMHHAEPIEGENRDLIDPEKGIYRFDDLIILKTAVIPAVLLEAGIIVNRNEEERLSQPEYQMKIVDAVISAIDAFCRHTDK